MTPLNWLIVFVAALVLVIFVCVLIRLSGWLGAQPEHAAPRHLDPGEFDGHPSPFGDDDTIAQPTVVYPSMLPAADTDRIPAWTVTPAFDPPAPPAPGERRKAENARLMHAPGTDSLYPYGGWLAAPTVDREPEEDWRTDGWHEIVEWLRSEPEPVEAPEPEPEVTMPAIPAHVLALLDGKTPDQFVDALFWPLERKVAMLPATRLALNAAQAVSA